MLHQTVGNIVYGNRPEMTIGIALYLNTFLFFSVFGSIEESRIGNLQLYRINEKFLYAVSCILKKVETGFGYQSEFWHSNRKKLHS